MRDGVGVGLSALGKNSQQVSISIHTTCGLVPEALVSLQFLMVTIPLLYGYVSQLSHESQSQPPDAAKAPTTPLFCVISDTFRYRNPNSAAPLF